jgi:mannose-6-phosphate isomerase
LLRLQNPIRGYAWGSHDYIAKVQGRPVPTAEPEAELWVGAHPDSPSTVDSQPLDKLIESAPEQYLGAEAVTRFGVRLPFLTKILAAQRPLSMQAHPDAAQAAAGFAHEERTGAAERNYVDPYHKPEMVVALEEFEALCGFRSPSESAVVLAGLGVRALEPVTAALRSGSLRDAVEKLYALPDPAAVAGAVATAHPLAGRLASFHPHDIGVVLALLLNHKVLRPGEAVWMPARTLHAYIRGAGVEAMAASDNVLRGGLTPKHKDVAELLRVLRFEPSPMPELMPETVVPGVITWPVPVPDFRFFRVTVSGAPIAFDPSGPRTALCVTGSATVADAGGSVTLRSGESAFGQAGAGPLTFTGDATLYLTSL